MNENDKISGSKKSPKLSDDSDISGDACNNNTKTMSSNKRAAETFYEIAETLLLSTAVVIIIFTFFVRLAVVDGPSMRQTLEHGDVLIVSDLFYEPEYGDIVVVQKINSAWPSPIVKRVIATGGQVVDIDFDTWTVTVDGEIIDESDYIYLAKDAIMTSNYEFPITVPEGQLFVMGDNRNHSSDSRDSRIGFIDTRSVFGRVICRVFPLQNLTIFERFS